MYIPASLKFRIFTLVYLYWRGFVIRDSDLHCLLTRTCNRDSDLHWRGSDSDRNVIRDSDCMTRRNRALQISDHNKISVYLHSYTKLN